MVLTQADLLCLSVFADDKKSLEKMNKLVTVLEDGTFKINKPEKIGKDWEEILLLAVASLIEDSLDKIKSLISSICFSA